MWGHGRETSSEAVGSGSGSDIGTELGSKLEVVVGDRLMKDVIKSGTDEGVTFSTIVNAGRIKTVVGSA